MLTPHKLSPRAAATSRAYVYLLIASVLLALIPTFWSSLDLQLARFFFNAAHTNEVAVGMTGASTWWWVQLLNNYTPTAFRVLVFLCLLLWLAAHLNTRWKRWRLALAFVALAGIAGPGLAVNGIVKPMWERARPSQVVEFGGEQQFSRAGVFSEECSKDCSFVSGHTSCGFFLCSLCLLVRRRRAAWIMVGVVTGAAIGFARICNLDHWLSDVLWAWPVTLISSWMVWRVLQRFESEM